MFILVLTLAAAEVAVGLALFLRLRRLTGSDDSDAISGLKG
jgi:NADH-quinone oxidoreductase subunit K